MAVRLNQKQAVRAVADRMTFHAGALSAERVTGRSSWHEGRLGGEEYRQWSADCVADRIAYVVRSYSTPIAWFTTDRGWIVPAEKYSVTTSRHQGIVRRALAYEAQFATALEQALAAC